MEIHHVLPNLLEFVPVPCHRCDYRFICWTTESKHCPIKTVRLIEEDSGWVKSTSITYNYILGDKHLLEKIGEDLLKAYGHQKRY